MDTLHKGGNNFQQQKAANRWEKYEVRKEYRDRGEELIFFACRRAEWEFNHQKRKET